jgi:acyl-CoA thioester hydrolase
MSKKPVVYKTTHRVKFSELDPFQHVSTANYATYFVDHRMESLARDIGWNLKSLEGLGFMTWVRRMEIDFIRPAQPDQEITLTSFVCEWSGPDGVLDCAMLDANGKTLAKCKMTICHVDRATSRPTPWPPELMELFYEKDPT